MLGDAALAARMAEAMLRRGVYVIGFSYPVVPQGQGPHPRADLRRPHAGRSPVRHGSIPGDESGVGDLKKDSGFRVQSSGYRYSIFYLSVHNYSLSFKMVFFAIVCLRAKMKNEG